MGLSPGEILVGWPGVEVPGDFLRGSCGVSSGRRCHMTASTAHVEKNHAHEGVYTWMVHCCRARRTRDAWGGPRTMSAARTSTIPVVSTTIPSAGPAWRLRLCRATSAWPVWATQTCDPDVHAAARGLIQDPALRSPGSVGQRVRPRAPLRAVRRHRSRVGGVAWSTSLPQCSGPASTRGRGPARCPPAAWVLRARCPRGALGSSPGQSPHPRRPGGRPRRRLGTPAA